MCYERYLRRHREADESREMWIDFERTEPADEPRPVADTTEPAPAEAPETAVTTER